MKGKITKKTVDGLIADVQAAGKAMFLWDSELAGFGAKATASACSYVVQYRLGGRDSPTRSALPLVSTACLPQMKRESAPKKSWARWLTVLTWRRPRKTLA